MKNYIYQLTNLSVGIKKTIQSIMLTLCMVFSVFTSNAQQYIPISCTGFNNDIIANGVGTSSIPGTSNPLIGLDGAKYTFMDNTFKYTSASALPTCFMPVSNTAASAQTAGLTYVFQGYGTSAVNNNNALTIDNNSTTYTTSPYPNSATLTLTPAASLFNLRVLYETVVNVAPLTVDVTVTFTDATTQTFPNNTCQNWFTVTLPAYSGMGRISGTGGVECGSTPNMFELQLALLPANQSKLVQSITFTIPTTLTTGTTADKVNYFHVMAVGASAPLCSAPAFQPSALVQGATTTSSISASFSNASTVPSGYLVVRYLSGATPTNPVDGTTYASNSTLGTGPNTGTVVQANSTTSFNATALFGSTAYDFYVYSYLTGNCAGPVYLTSYTAGVNKSTFTTNACGTLNGIIPVGPTAPASPAGFPTLTAALSYINANGLGAATILELQSNYVSTSETFPITFNSNPCIGPLNTLTIRPASNVVTPLSITTSNATAAILLNGAQYITFDGRSGGTGTAKRLSIINTLTTAVSTIQLVNESSNNNILYCDVQGASTTAAANPATSGVIFIGSTTGTSGNDNNTISLCDVHGNGVNLPAVCIAAQNSTTAGAPSNNDNNIITGNNVYDFFHATLASAGILITAGNNNFNISDNRLYQTAARVYTSTQTVRGLWITPNTASLTSASGYVINNNIIGNASSAGTGTYAMSGATAWIFNGMDLSMGVGTPTIVQNNTVSNISMSVTSTATNAFVGINVANGAVNVTNNFIGSETASSVITFTTAAANGGAMGIRTGGGTTLNITGNKIGGFSMLGSTIAFAPAFQGIAASGGTTLTVSNNVIGSGTLANSIQFAQPCTSATAQTIRGIIVNPASGTSIVSGNLIANINTNIVATGTQATTLVGIIVTTTSSTISNNTIRNLTSSSQTTAGGSTPVLIGIAYTSTSSASVISGNTIHTLKNTNTTTAASLQVTGIYFSGPSSGTPSIEGNNIHSLSITSPTNSASFLTGIDAGVNSGVTITIKNNMIRLGHDETGASIISPCTVRGITKNVPNANIWFNSIYIGGTGVGNSAIPTFALARTNNSTDDIRNNILVNNRSNAIAGGGKHYQIYLSGTPSLNLNNNIYYGSGIGSVFAFNGTADVPAYSTTWVSGDVNSRTIDPRFINPTGSASSVDLHIQAPPTTTPVEGLGVDIISVTQDFDGDIRSATSPVDIGADAGNFTPLAACSTPTATAVTLTPASLSVINGTFTNVGSDAYLVVRYLTPASPVVNPVNGNLYATGSSLGGGTVIAIINSGGPYSFSATGLGNETDYTFYVYSYNASCIGGPLYAPAIPQNASTLSCVGAGGIVKIGPGAPASPAGFPTLTAAIAHINTFGLSASTILELRNDYVSSAETFPITFSNIPCVSAIKTLTIRPEAGANGKVITASNAGPTVDFSGARFVTIDGRPGGIGASMSVTSAGALNSINLNIVNTNIAGVAVRLDNQSQNNTVMYCDLQGNNTQSGNLPGTLAGVVCIGNVTVINGNDNNTVDNCNIHSTSSAAWPTMGVYGFGPASRTTIAADFNDNNTISNNNIYDFYSTTLFTAGVEVERGCNAWNITGNSFFQTATRTPSVANITNRVIFISPSSGSTIVGNGFTISGNYIGGSQPLCNGTPYTYNPSVAHIIRFIDVAVNGGTATNIKSNTIQNINLTENGTSDLMSAVFLTQSGSVNVGGPLPADGNLIGSTTSTGNIQLNNTNAGVTAAHMIVVSSAVTAAAPILIQNNKIGGISLNGAGVSFSGILCNSTASGANAVQLTIKDNLIGSTTVANSINQTVNTAAQPQYIRAINIASSPAVLTISNNTIANLTNNGTSTVTDNGNTGTASVCQVLGMYLISSSTTGAIVTGNTIYNLTGASQQTSSGTAVAVGGISLRATASTTGANISGNTVHSLASTSTSTSARTCMQGIFYSTESTTSPVITVARNFVHSFDITNPNNTVSRFFGIFLNNGKANIVNNMVRFGIKPDGTSLTTPCEINGITTGGPNTTGNIYSVYNNTVYIGGTGVGVTNANATLAYYRSQSGVSTPPCTVDLRNNIFINNRSNATTGGGKHYQLFFFNDANITSAINNNIYLGTGTGAVFAYNGIVDVPNYSSLWFPGDINSYNEDPILINPTGNLSAVNLHLDPTAPTRAEQFGEFVPVPTDDFDGEDRSALTPVDIGADAGNYTALFYCGGSPLVANAVLTNTVPICGSGSRKIVLQGITATPGFTYQWKESTTGVAGSFQKIIGATTSSYTSPVLTQTMYYLCEISCDSSEATTPSSIVAIEINQNPVVAITPASGNVCSGSTISLTASGASTYVWTTTAPTAASPVYLITSLLTLPTITSIPNSTTNGTSTPTWTYRVTGTSAAGCVSTPISATFNVVTSAVVPQTLTYTQNPDPTCTPGVPVTLTVNNSGTIGTGQWIYNWYDQSGITLLQSTTSASSTNSFTPPTPSVNGNYVYTATVTNSLCPSSYALTSPTFFAGYTSTKIVTNANCGNNGTVTVLPSGQNNFTTWYANDFTTGLLGSGQDTAYQMIGTTVQPVANIFSLGECRLTNNTGSNQGALLVKNPTGINTNNLRIDFTLTTSPRSSGTAGFYGADGMAWSYAPNVYPGLVTIGTAGFYPENGTGSGIRLAFDAVNNGTNNLTGVYLMYNCAIPNQGPTTDGVIAFKGGTFWQGLTNAPISIEITEDGYVSVRLNSILIFDHVQLPAAYLISNKSTWYHAFSARTGASFEVHAIDNLKIRYNSYQFSSNSTNGLDGTWQSSNILGGLAAGTHPVWVRNPSDTTCVVNTGNAVITNVTSPSSATTVTVSGSNPILCAGSILDLTTDVFVPGAVFLWESGPTASGPWTPAAGINDKRIYTTAPLNEDTWFRCNFTCPSSSMITAAPLLADVNVGTLTSINGPYMINCPGKPVTMNVTPGANTTLIWYEAASGGSPLATGNTYSDVPTSLPKTYYVEPTTTLLSNHYYHGGLSELVGDFGTEASNTAAAGNTLRFTTASNIRIDSIKVFPTVVGLFTVALQASGTNTTIGTPYSMVVTTSMLNKFINVPVAFDIVGGGNYQLSITSGVGYKYYSGYTGPYSSSGIPYMNMGGNILTITGSAQTPTAATITSIYGGIWDINISTSCASVVGSRIPVVVGLTPSSAVNVTPGTSSVCQGGIQVLSASSVTEYSNYNWSPATNLFIDAAATIPYTLNTDATTVYARSLNTGSSSFTVTASGSADGCSNTKTADVTVTPAPAVTVSASAPSICLGSNVTLNASSSNSGYSYTWNPGGSSLPSASVSPSIHTNYTVNAVDNTNGPNRGCVTSASIPVGVNKVGVTAGANPIGICSGDNSTLFSTASTSEQYFGDAATPSPVPVPVGGVTTLSKTVALTSGDYNNGYWNVTLPFNFAFFGDLFNTISVNTNGFITLGDGSVVNNVGTIPNLTSPNNAIYLAAKDWTMAASGNIRYFTVGAAPNRRFVLDYLSIPSVSATGNLSGQIVLNESNGRIEMTLLGTDASSLKTLGIENASGSTAYSPSLRNGNSPWSVTSPEAWVFSPTGGSFTYAWTPAGNLDDATIASPFASLIFSTTTFNVTVNDQTSGCSNSASTTVTTGDILSATVNTDQSSVCLGQSATIFANPTGGCSPYTYQWEDANGIIGTFPFVNVSPTSTTTYSLILTDAVLNEFTYSITITVNPIPAVAATPGLICGTGTATLTASGASTYSWSPATNLNTTTGASVITSTGVTRIYTVTGTSAVGCSNTATSTVTISNPIVLTAAVAPAQINTGHNAQLTAQVKPPGLFFLSSLSNETYSPLSGGGITIVNTAGQLTSGLGSTSQDDGAVVVSLPFTFDYLGNSYTQMTMCTNGWVSAGNIGTIDALTMRTASNLFTATIPNNTIAPWFGDMGANFGTIYPGSMRYGLIGTDKFAFQWDQAVGSSFSNTTVNLISFQVNIYGANSSNPGRIEFIYGPQVGALSLSRSVGVEDLTGGSTHFLNALVNSNTATNLSTAWPGNGNGYRFDAVSNNDATFSWTPATFLSSTSISNPVAQNMTATTTYTVTATNASGCSATATASVTVGLPFSTTASSSANNFCQGGSTTLSATATGGGLPYASYSWSDGTSTVGTGSTLSIIPPAGTTTYTVTVTDVDNFTTTASVQVTVRPNPTIILSKSGDICGSGSSLITASGNSTSYVWNASPSLVVNSPGDNATANPTITTSYGITGTLNGCSTSSTIPVNVYPVITVSASATPATICQNGSSQLNVTPTAGLTFSWSPATSLSSSTIANPMVTNATASTVYTVTATNATTGCSGTSTVLLTVGSPLVVAASSNVPEICAGNSASLSSTATGGGLPYTYSWKAGATAVGSTPNITVTPSTTTSYTLFVTDACLAVVQSNIVTVVVNPLPSVSVSPLNSFLCGGVSTSTNLTATGADTYVWTPAAGLSATTGSSVFASPALSTVYSVTGTNTLTGCIRSATATVNITALSTTAQAYSYGVCHGSNGQLAAYGSNTASNYALSSVPYNAIPVSGATTITSWAFTDVDDGSNGPVALPFTFNFYGVNYNQIYIGTNGYISFSDLSTISGANSRKAANINTPTAANNIVALCYSDLHASNGGGSVKYFVSGTAPNRVFVIVYDVVFLTNTGRVKGQIQLYENSNIVEVHVQEVNHGTSIAQNTLGIENSNGSQRVVPASRVPAIWNVAAATPEAWKFSPNAGYSYSWSPSSFLDNVNVAAPNVTGITSSTTYTVTTTEISSGCQATDTVKVTDIPLPSAAIGGSAEICVASSANLNFAFTGTAPFVYSYSDGTNTFGPFTSAGLTATKSVSPIVATTYSLVSVSDNFCTGTVSGTALITFDTQAPTITCPANVTANTNAGVDFATGVALGTPVASDNCTVSSVTNNGTFAYLVGNTTVTWTATDSNGNTATCSQVVTVIDNQAPIITCPATVTVNSDLNQCHASNVDLGILSAIDNNGVANISNNELSQYPIGNTTVTWTATDLSGNTSTCNQTVTVIDNQVPVISCPASITVNPDNGVCYATAVNLGTPVTSDNCAITVNNNAPAQFQAGTTTVIWTVSDGTNSATCSQNVTVVDVEKPVLVNCPANLSSCSPISWTPPTATDNCTPSSGITITSNYAPGAYFPSGTTTVIYTATDANGNTSTCSFVVTKQDSSSMNGLTLTSNKPFNNICNGDNITLTINGITSLNKGYSAQWKWFSGTCGGTAVTGSSNQTSITVSPTANTTYFVRLEGACNTTTCISLPVVVTTAPPSGNPVIIYYPAIAYAGASDSIVVSAVPGATFYHWTTSGNSNILFDGHAAPYESSSPKVMLTFVSPATNGNGIGNYHIQFFAGNGCGKTNSNNIRIRATVDAPSTVTGPSVTCIGGQAKTYTANPVVGAKSYQWSFTSGAGTMTGNGTQTVNVTFTSLPATLCVHGVSAFGSAGPDQCVTITNTLATPGPITGSATPCRGGSEIYSIPNVDGATSYVWSTDIAGANIIGSGTSVTVNYPAGLFSGNLCVKALSACDTSDLACLSIVSGTVPPVGPITGIAEGLCSISADFEVPSIGATNYAWSVPTGANVTAGAGSNAISVSFGSTFAGGSITVISTNQCGVSYDTLEVTGAPAIPVISGPSSVCGGDVEPYIAVATGATGYDWSVASEEGTILFNTNPNEIMLEWITNGGTVTVTATNSCGSSTASLTVTSNCRIAGDLTMMESVHALVFPNPSQGRMTLLYNSPDNADYLLKVTDLTGRILQHESLSALRGSNKHEIDLGHVAKGVYMLSLENTLGENIVIRLVID